MARIGENAFRQYIDGQDRLTAREYMSERELIRLAVNDLDDKVQRTESIREEFSNTVNEIGQTKQEIETRIGEFTQTIDQTSQELQNKASKEEVNTQLENKASKSEVQEVSTKLEDIIQQGVSCTQLGMVPNDASKGADNFSKLVGALRQQKKVLVDGVYNINVTTTDINKNVHLIGINASAKLILQGSTAFVPVSGCSSIIIDSVNFETANASERTILFHGKTAIKINKLSVTNCSYTGTISLIRWDALLTIDPTVVIWGIKDFLLKNNRVTNCRTGFVVLADVPFDLYTIEDNRVINFDYTFFTCSISNTHSHGNKIFNEMKTLNVRNNTVYCTDDWWGFTTSSGSYFAFIVSENKETYYTGNTVEGMKTEAEVATYDAYLSSAYVEYKNNIWKNNICFHPNKTNNTLMKAKGNGDYRVFENNTFTIEESFATKFNKDKALLKVDLYSCTSQMKRWVIKNNDVDVYHLMYPPSSQTIDEQWIEGNNFKSVICNGSILNYRTYSDRDYKGTMHKLINNTIINSGPYNGTDSFQLVRSTDYTSLTNIAENVVIANNTVVATNLAYVLYSVNAKKVTFESNRIDYVFSGSEINSGIGYLGHVQELQNNGNVLNKEKGKLFENRSPVTGKVEENYTIKEAIGQNNASALYLNTSNPIDVRYRYMREYEIISSEGVSRFNYSVEYFYDTADSKNKITFTNAAGTQITVACGEGESNGAKIKLNGTVAGNIAVALGNNSGSCYFYLEKQSTTYKTINVRTYTVVV